MERSLDAFKLPSGRHGLPREHVAENQRWRLLCAATELLDEDGYLALTAHGIARRAAVSSQTFYVHFEGVDDCLRVAFEVGARNLESAAARGGASAGDRPERIAGALGETCSLIAREPAMRRLFSVEAMAAVPTLADSRAELVVSLAARLQCEAEGSTAGSGRGSARFRLLVQAVLGVLAEAAAAELSAPSPLAAHVARLVSDASLSSG